MGRSAMSQLTKNLATALLCAAACLGACSKAKEPAKEPPKEAVKEPPKEPPKEAPKDQVEVFSWWTGAGEQEGLDAMIADFKSKNAGIDFINAAVSGGAGTNAKAILANRLQAGNPPDSVHTDATVTLRPIDGRPTITKIALVTVGRVPGLDEAAFIEHAQAAKAGCPVSRALAGVPEITLEASLAS